MSAIGYLIVAVAKVIGLIVNLYTMIVVIAALISWVNPDPYNPLVRILYGLTEPAFRLVRRFLPSAARRIRIDISPIVVLVILTLLDSLITGALVDIGRGFMK